MLSQELNDLCENFANNEFFDDCDGEITTWAPFDGYDLDEVKEYAHDLSVGVRMFLIENKDLLIRELSKH